MPVAANYLNRVVKAVKGAVVYDAEGYRIPEDTYVRVPISPGIITAIKVGDLEALPPGTPAPPRPQRQAAAVRTRHARPAPPPTQAQ